MIDKKYIEKKLKRTSGMSIEAKQHMEEGLSTAPFRARCWQCKTWNEAPRSELKACTSCGANLWSRNG